MSLSLLLSSGLFALSSARAPPLSFNPFLMGGSWGTKMGLISRSVLFSCPFSRVFCSFEVFFCSAPGWVFCSLPCWCSSGVQVPPSPWCKTRRQKVEWVLRVWGGPRVHRRSAFVWLAGSGFAGRAVPGLPAQLLAQRFCSAGGADIRSLCSVRHCAGLCRPGRDGPPQPPKEELAPCSLSQKFVETSSAIGPSPCLFGVRSL